MGTRETRRSQLSMSEPFKKYLATTHYRSPPTGLKLPHLHVRLAMERFSAVPYHAGTRYFSVATSYQPWHLLRAELFRLWLSGKALCGRNESKFLPSAPYFGTPVANNHRYVPEVWRTRYCLKMVCAFRTRPHRCEGSGASPLGGPCPTSLRPTAGRASFPVNSTQVVSERPAGRTSWGRKSILRTADRRGGPLRRPHRPSPKGSKGWETPIRRVGYNVP